MTTPDSTASSAPVSLSVSVVITASFTAEPLEPILRFWFDELGYAGAVHFAPYNQVLPQLLDPASDLGRNARGVNIALVRLEDWTRFRTDDVHEPHAIEEGIAELTSAVHEFAARSASPLILAVCPPTRQINDDPDRRALHTAMTTRLHDAIGDLASVHWLEADAFGMESLDPAAVEDARGDAIGHMPYTALAYTAIATALARRIDVIKAPRPKVLALDCDNTLWKGVVGEEGPLGVTFPPGLLALHERVVRLEAAGMVVCLLSKNVASDVFAVFDARRDEMVLKHEHVISERVNWQPKSENIAELAQELNLGLDSFVFIDDNPVECAEMRARRPEVLTLELPSNDDDVAEFFQHIWPLDILKVTDEDRGRTSLYRENAERDRFARGSGGIAAFLAGLELRIDIDSPADQEWSRVAQLTQKTNQFNFTTRRRDESEIRQLAGLECLRVKVTDRFGNYGLVGIVIFDARGEKIEIDTFLLSCRVLGRGVEHAMMARLGRLATERGKTGVNAWFAPTAKNEPALSFLESVGSAYREPNGEGFVYRFPAEIAAELVYSGPTTSPDGAASAPQSKAKPTPLARDRSASYMRIATELRQAASVLEAARRQSETRRPDLDSAYEGPRTALERDLVEIWSRLLGFDRVGVFDDFTKLGGTSLKAAQMFVEIDTRFGRKLPMTTILEAPTIATLAPIVAGFDSDAPRESLRLLEPGRPGTTPLFLVHDGDGETLLYLNLARRFPEDVAVYGLEPRGDRHVPIFHTRIPEMAAYYLELVRKVQPEGPYRLGGMCAGGVIAFEMALRLEADGETVDFVALLDSAAPLVRMRSGLEAEDRRRRFRIALTEQVEQSSKLRRALGKLAKLSRKAKGYATYQVAMRARALTVAAKFRAIRKAVDAGRPVPGYARGLPVRRVYERAEAEYRPNRRLQARAILFRASEGVGNDAPFVEVYDDAMLGWERWVCEPVVLREMPGGHSSMLQEPNVAVMADRFHEFLAQLAEVGAGY